MRAYPYRPTKPLPLAVGGKIRFDSDGQPYTVQAITEHFAIATKHTPFVSKDVHTGAEITYSVIDWERGWRGPLNYLGGGADCATREECESTLAELEKAYADAQQFSKDHNQDFINPLIELSHRHSIYFGFTYFETADGVRHMWKGWEYLPGSVRSYNFSPELPADF